MAIADSYSFARTLRLGLCLTLIPLFAACGGDSDGTSATSGADNPSIPGSTDGQGGNGGDNAGGGNPPDDVVQGRSCEQDFSPERVDRGEDCAPQYFAECPPSEPDQAIFGFSSVPSCEGVTVEAVSQSGVAESFSGTLDYVVLKPANGAPKAVMVNLHFREIGRAPQTAAATHAALMRQAELVKARDVMIILPGAPSGNWPQTTLTDNTGDLLGELPLGDALDQLAVVDDATLMAAAQQTGFAASNRSELRDEATADSLPALVDALSLNFASVEDHLDYIELAMNDALTRFGGEQLPRYIAGLSNGGIYAARFACRRPELFDAALIVAGTVGPVEGEQCKGKAAIGTVQVHGTFDALVPYEGGLSYPVRGGGAPLSLLASTSPGALDPAASGLPSSLDAMEEEAGALAGLVSTFRSEENDSFLDQLFALGAIVPLSGDDDGLFLDVFGPNNGCSGDLKETVVPADTTDGDSAGDVVIERFARCENPAGRSSYLVTINEGGHHWPGYDSQSGQDFSAFGPISLDFDSTIQGYDLLRRAGGQR